MSRDVEQWLEDLDLAKYQAAFAENEIAFDDLAELTEGDLKEMGLPIGPRRRALKAIALLDDQPAAPAERPLSEAPQPAAAQAAERRQLTVMFCDLVGSTELSRRLDPEDLREVMRRYQDTVAGAVVRFDGHVAKLLGDGVLAFFGWPRAYEKQAERAVRAGLAAIEALAGERSDDGRALQVRIGIATGQVVIGDIAGEAASESDAIAGETPNLAARLQEVASPGQVVIGAMTRLLVAESFELLALGATPLKGFPTPTEVWQVLRARSGEDQPQTTPPSLRLVGREPELALLRRAWEQSRTGIGQVVLISGEPGIGKSRLVENLGAELKAEGCTRIVLSCSPYYSNSSLYPLIGHLQRVLDWSPDDSDEAKRDKLETTLGRFSIPLDEVVPLFADLLSLPLEEDRYPSLTLTPQQQKQQTLDAVVAWLQEEAERRPVMQVWEDLHWADPSTLELLTLIIEQGPTVPILNVLTFRPDFTPPWPQRSHMIPVTLNRLERPEVELLITQQTSGKALPEEVVEHIASKSDGVPLYVEELTRTILEADFLSEGDDGYVLSGALAEVAIPATLQDSLMARLDRQPGIREVAQIGAVLGREFSYEMIQAVAPLDESRLQEGLEKLVAAELLYQRGRPPRARYLFKHALVQDAAYQSLLRRTRQQQHRQVADTLERRFPTIVATEPELIAHHYTAAGMAAQAIPFWQRAGERASSSWTNEAAAHHFETALKLLTTLPEGTDRDETELTLRLALGSALQKTKGHSGDETVETTYTRAELLSQHVGNPQQRMAALFGQWRYHIWQAHFKTSRVLAERLLEVAERTADPSDLMLANYALGSTMIFQGDTESAVTHSELAASIYNPQLGATLAYRLGHDPRVTRPSALGMLLWLRGFPDRAKQANLEAIAIANELQDQFSLALASVFCALVCECRREYDVVALQSETAYAIAIEHQFDFWAALARIHQGSVLASRGEMGKGIARMQEGIAAYEATNMGLLLSYYISRLAECQLHAGTYDEALQTLATARAFAEESGEHWWDSEHLRLQGVAALTAAKDHAAAEASFQNALDTARQQNANSLELRAATDLARLWHEQKQTARARDLLAPVYGRFSEGLDTADLKEAKLLLDATA